MKLSIIPSDKSVCVDGECKWNLDLSSCGIPSGVHALQWNGSSGWIELSGPPPQNETINSLPTWAQNCVAVYEQPAPPPPEPTPDQVTAQTIATAVADLQTVAYLTTSEMGTHITPESRQEVTDYIHAVANILATAQSMYGTGEAYAPTFPPMPTAMPQLGGDGLPAPYIQFIVVN